MFYHDHAWGITRLNVYAGEAAGYLITDDTEKALIRQRHHPRRRRHDPAGHPGPDLRPGRQRQTRPLRRTRPGTQPAGAATATSGTTTSTCRRRTPATRAA